MDALTPPSPDQPEEDNSAHPSASGRDPDHGNGRSRSRRREPKSLPSRNDILARLDALPRLIFTGFLRPAAANAARACLEAVLRAMDRTANGGSAATAAAEFDIARWREILTSFPDAANDLARFVGDEVVDRFFDEVEDAEEPGDE